MKLKSFTYQELLVAMAISTVVVLISLSVYHILNHQFSGYRKYHRNMNELQMLDFALHHDIEIADSIIMSEDNLMLYKKGKDPVKYFFNKDHIIRSNNLISDTFFIKPASINTSFESNNPNDGLVNQINLEVQRSDTVLKFNYYKTPSAFELMKRIE